MSFAERDAWISASAKASVELSTWVRDRLNAAIKRMPRQ